MSLRGWLTATALVCLIAGCAFAGAGCGDEQQPSRFLKSEERLEGMYEACKTIAISDPAGERPPILADELAGYPRVDVTTELVRSNGMRLPGTWSGASISEVLAKHGVEGPFTELRIVAWDEYVAKVPLRHRHAPRHHSRLRAGRRTPPAGGRPGAAGGGERGRLLLDPHDRPAGSGALKRLSMRAALIFVLSACLTLAVLSSGCGGGIPESERSELILATTTSMLDSGLLEELVVRFEEEYPYRVKAIAVGSGAALLMARQGEADVTVTHEPNAEKELMEAGFGESWQEVMYNDFIIVGPPEDPAGIAGMTEAAEAFRRIAESESSFFSRGDASGTNAMELATWSRAGINPDGDWYHESGQGMGYSLRMADDGGAYTLSDRATFIVLEKALRMEVMVEGDPDLINHYSAIVVNPEKFSGLNHQGAVDFANFLLGDETQEFIAGFGWDRYHQHLFYPVSPE